MIEEVIKNAPDIIEGHMKEFLGIDEDLYQERIKVCKKCPLYSVNGLGEVCDSNKEYNGVRGCSCRLRAKLTLPYAKCVLNRW